MRVILIDDEPIALDVLIYLLSNYSGIDIVGSYTDPLLALKEIKKLQPDVIFLDIEMGEINGLDFAEFLMEQEGIFEIVFITAYSRYAVDAFEINAIDYLLKPIQEKRLYKTIERLKEKFKRQDLTEKKISILDNRIKINSFGRFEAFDSMNYPLIWRTQKNRELFIYLWKRNGTSASKGLIMETIFPDKSLDKATTLLHTTVYQLRKNLEGLGYLNGVVYLNDSYQLNVPVKSDFEELNNILRLNRHNEEIIKEILGIYNGEFLEEEGYHWAIETQQEYKDIVFNILEEFSKIQLEEERWTPVLKMCLDKMQKMDSYNESVAEMIIQYYGKQGKRSNLEDFFNYYVENLWREMNLKPMKSTIDLYRRYMENC